MFINWLPSRNSIWCHLATSLTESNADLQVVPPLRAQSFCHALERRKPFKSFVSFLLHNGLGTQAGKVLIHHLRDKETETNRAHVSQSTNTKINVSQSLTPNLLLFSFPAIWRNVSQKGTCLFFASPFDLQFLIYFLVFVLSGCTFQFISGTAELLLSQRRMTEIKVSMLSILFLTA